MSTRNACPVPPVHRFPNWQSSCSPLELEQITLDRDTLYYKDVVAHRYAELVYHGQWFTPLREALDAIVDVTQRNVTSEARLKPFRLPVKVRALEESQENPVSS